jgi:hypothetical protein
MIEFIIILQFVIENHEAGKHLKSSKKGFEKLPIGASRPAFRASLRSFQQGTSASRIVEDRYTLLRIAGLGINTPL